MRQRICTYLLIILAVTHASARGEEAGYDFRIVIDVTDSMKQNDPQDRRVAALKLLNGLIPSGSQAGVWTFGRYVDMAVKWGRVDDGWRKQADLGAARINSSAELTNIENALARASVGWERAAGKSRRILLLLTDGKVDISVDPDKNEKSRARVLSENLAALKKAAVQVHSIALSNATDEVLLKRLAVETGGSFTLAQSADELHKLFYRVFERAVHPDMIALQDKQFQVDPGISEMTLLIFRGDANPPTILIPPDSPAISEIKPRGARWRSGAGFDLVTVARPEPGSWRIDAEMDADSRILVVSDLRLAVDGIPAFGEPEDVLSVAAELFDRDGKIRKNSYLRFVDFSLTHIDVDGSATNHALTHTSLREDKGRFLHELAAELSEGTHGFVVSATGRSFNRSKRFEMQVQRPIEIVVDTLKKPGVYELRLRARAEYLKPHGLVAEVEIEAPDGLRESLRLEPSLDWLRARVETSQDGIYRAHVRVSAQNHAREIHDIDLGSFPMQGVRREIPAAQQVDIVPGTTSAAASQSPTGDGVDWRRIGIVVVGINVTLILLGLTVWLVFRRNRADDEFAIEDEEFGI
ncbi:MAG: VWA domain-containing protein [Gammaproteobacteria bacterium]|nr:VWA domain-containing protein [Gammaproteobacteria bacterium]MDH3448294.1 VWA domain-containing protein [Gammaproteobacteria bacterium]